MPAKEAVLIGSFVVAAAAIVVGIGLVGRRRADDKNDVGRMRELYVGLSLYEEGNSSADPPSLLPLVPYLSGPDVFLASADPYAATSAKRFPDDAGLPDGPRDSPFRISFDYAGDFAQRSSTSRRVVLADEWTGSVSATGDFHAEVGGPVLQVDSDGAIFRKADRGGPKPLGNITDLFGP
jgi:hypothetical protein